MDNFSLKNSKINAREYWMIHRGDKGHNKKHTSYHIYLDYEKAKKDAIELSLQNPEIKFYILKTIEVYDFLETGLVAEEIEKIK
jgi:hypothetical protein